MKKIYDTPSVEITVFDSTEITNADLGSALVPASVKAVQNVDVINF